MGIGHLLHDELMSGAMFRRVHVTLDWKSLLGIPFPLPFCSAVITDDGTIYVSGAVPCLQGRMWPLK